VNASAFASGNFLVVIVSPDVTRVTVKTDTTTYLTEDRYAAPAPFGDVRFMVLPLDERSGGGTGTVRFLGADGTEVFPSRVVDWGPTPAG
jgi:hypothetical protein